MNDMRVPNNLIAKADNMSKETGKDFRSCLDAICKELLKNKKSTKPEESADYLLSKSS